MTMRIKAKGYTSFCYMINKSQLKKTLAKFVGECKCSLCEDDRRDGQENINQREELHKEQRNDHRVAVDEPVGGGLEGDLAGYEDRGDDFEVLAHTRLADEGAAHEWGQEGEAV